MADDVNQPSQAGQPTPDPRMLLASMVENARARIRECSPEELSEAIESGIDWLILDVREPYEYERRHVPGSILVPRGTIEAAVDPNGRHRVMALCDARSRPLAVLCETGARSALVAALLLDFGFTDVVNVSGGLELWEAEDLPVAQGPYTGILP
jgi:rhodanese-related sulfurtransferase